MHSISIKDLTGQRFGNLIVIKATEKRKFKHVVWLCKCDCGNEKEIIGNALTSGQCKSCGCLRVKKSWDKGKNATNYLHGMSRTPIHNAWIHMRQRCYNGNDKSYPDYGGRGITVCKKWQTFEGFYEDMGSSYKEGYSIDRIDVNGNYEPSNCRWATNLVQANNKRDNKRYTVEGITDTMSNLSRKYGITHYAVRTRLMLGWDVEKAFMIPVRKHKTYKKKESAI
jgi:hypothetical protein